MGALTNRRLTIFNTALGVLFTSRAFTSRFQATGGISMDGKGRALDTVFIQRLSWSVK